MKVILVVLLTAFFVNVSDGGTIDFPPKEKNHAIAQDTARGLTQTGKFVLLIFRLLYEII